MEQNQIKKNYQHIPLPKRVNLLIKVLCEKLTVRQAAKLYDIKFSTAKAIIKLFKKEGRIGKNGCLQDIEFTEQEDMLKKIVKLESVIKEQKKKKKEVQFQELATRLDLLQKEDQPVQIKNENQTIIQSPQSYYQQLAERLQEDLRFEQQRYQVLTQQYQQKMMYIQFVM